IAVPMCLALFTVVARPDRSAPARVAERHRSPTDVAILPDGRRALTANEGADSVSLVDLNAGKVLAEIACGRRPVAVERSAEGRLWDTENRALLGERTIDEGFNLRGLTFAPDGESLIFAMIINKAKNVSLRNIEEGWLMGGRLSRVPVKDKKLQDPERI